MNSQTIKDILNNKINFSLFQISELTQEQMEVVYHNLKSKITKQNIVFERMLDNQKNSQEGFFNKKTIHIVIQYLLDNNTYTIDEIKQTINRIINMYEMISEIEEIKEKTTMTDFIVELNLEEIEEFTKYINKLTINQYNTLKCFLYEENNICDFLDEIMRPYIEYHFNNSERFVAHDLVYDFLLKLKNDKDENNKDYYYNIIIDYILSEDRVLSIALKKHDISIIVNYINVLNVNNDKLNTFIKNVNDVNMEKIMSVLPKEYQSFTEHKEHVDICGLNKKSDIKIIQMLYIVEKILLKKFLKNQCQYSENKMNKILINLEKIGIKTYFKLENVVLKNKFVKMTRENDKKILPGKIVKMIIYKILDSNDKLELLEEQKINIESDIDILNLEFSKIKITKNNDDSIDELKQQRTILNNLIILLKENGVDYKTHEESLLKIDSEIKDYYLKMDSTEMINENITEISEMMKVLNLSNDEKEKMINLVDNFQKELSYQQDIYGENFKQDNDKLFINRNIDNKLVNLVDKYQKESEKEDKDMKKQNFIKLQNDLVNNYLRAILKQIDYKYNINNIKLYDMLFQFIKTQINKKIIPRIYKKFSLGDIKYNRNQTVYHILKMIINMFVIVLNFTNKKIDYTNVYDNVDNIIKCNKKIKKVIMKSNGKYADLIKENENDVIVEYLGQEIKMQKNEIILIEDLLNKEIKIIKGNYKGLYAKIYTQKDDYVLATKDTYGKNINCNYLPRVTSIKLKYDEFKINKNEENRKFIVENKELYDYFKNTNKNLYAMTKFEMNKYYTILDLENFEQMYKLIIELINDYKTNEYNKYQQLKDLKKQYVSIKKEISVNKTNKRVYITLNKKLKKTHNDIRSMEKNIRLIKETLINNSNNLNDNYTYVKKDGLFHLKEHTIKYNINEKIIISAEKKKEMKKVKLQNEKKMMKQAMNDMVTDITNMMGDLLC